VLFEELNIFDSVLNRACLVIFVIKDSVGFQKNFYLMVVNLLILDISKDKESNGTNITKTFRIFKQ
jgi:hypothetical protein